VTHHLSKHNYTRRLAQICVAEAHAAAVAGSSRIHDRWRLRDDWLPVSV
jgi:hypothetical protein